MLPGCSTGDALIWVPEEVFECYWEVFCMWTLPGCSTGDALIWVPEGVFECYWGDVLGVYAVDTF